MKSKEEIEQLAESEYGTEIGSIRGSNPYDLEGDRKNGYIKGYSQCQEDVAHKMNNVMETLLKIRDCKDYGNNSSSLARELIQSLNKQD
jgi:hypothetical protein